MRLKNIFPPQLSILILLGLSLGFSQKATATSNALGVASNYNVFTIGNFSESNTDVEGALAAGGNITFSNSSIGANLTSSQLTSLNGDAVVAGGNVSLINGQVDGGSVVYEGTLNTSGETLSHGSSKVTSTNSPINFSSAATSLKSLSTSLDALATTGTPKTSSGAITLTGTGSLEVFDLSGSTLASANGFTINAAAGATVVVNISGTSDSLPNFQMTINGTSEEDVLYNFYQATTLTDNSTGIDGSILAPQANVTFGYVNVNGNVVANSVTGNAQFNDLLFQGNLSQQTVTHVPEPSNLVGLGLVALISCYSYRQGKKVFGN
jgi:choice-of-anchor A domain-containing protein